VKESFVKDGLSVLVNLHPARGRLTSYGILNMDPAAFVSDDRGAPI